MELRLRAGSAATIEGPGEEFMTQTGCEKRM